MIEYILWALVITSKIETEDQVVGIYRTQEWCKAEAARIIETGPSAYCVPVNQESVVEADKQIKSLIVLLKEESIK